MDNNEIADEKTSFFTKHLFGTMIVCSIFIAIVIVFVSMWLYYKSGAYQLDLSSPNYVDVRSKIDNTDDSVEYSNTGNMDSNAIKDFNNLFSQKVQKVKSVDVFGGDPLNPESLGMTDSNTAFSD